MRADLLLLVVFVVLVLDSRRLRALARSTVRVRRDAVADRGIPAGADPDQVGITLRHIQMRAQIDWQDGGRGWDGPEILPTDDSEPSPVDDAPAEPEPKRALPVLWKPMPNLSSWATGGQQRATTTAA
jgi:hypothetical protein